MFKTFEKVPKPEDGKAKRGLQRKPGGGSASANELPVGGRAGLIAKPGPECQNAAKSTNQHQKKVPDCLGAKKQMGELCILKKSDPQKYPASKPDNRWRTWGEEKHRELGNGPKKKKLQKSKTGKMVAGVQQGERGNWKKKKKTKRSRCSKERRDKLLSGSKNESRENRKVNARGNRSHRAKNSGIV